MFNQLMKFLGGGEWPSDSDEFNQLEVAVAALLVEAARMSDRFDDAERLVIERILSRSYDLPSDATARLLTAAEDADAGSTQLFPFTHLIAERMTPQQRVGVIEMLWETVYADGSLSPDDDALIRQVAGLIYVSDRDRGEAHLRVMRRLGL